MQYQALLAVSTHLVAAVMSNSLLEVAFDGLL
jgi:hypothetical protein